MKVTVKIYDECKYNKDAKVVDEVSYTITMYEVNYIEDDEILKTYDCTDPHKEYLVLYFEDGNTATFRSSYVDLFIIL